jgi:PleD family two-component response regulator
MKSKDTMTSNYFAILTDEDRAKGYSIASHGGSVMLLKWKKPIAWFSAAISVETMRAMIELIRACEEHGRAQSEHR